MMGRCTLPVRRRSQTAVNCGSAVSAIVIGTNHPPWEQPQAWAGPDKAHEKNGTPSQSTPKCSQATCGRAGAR